MIELIHELEVQNQLGEGVIWDPIAQRLWWTDIESCQIYQYDPVGKSYKSWETPERLACFAPVVINGESQSYLVAAFESGFAYYEHQTGRTEWIKKVEADNHGTRLNDGRTDRQGRFWAGTMVEHADLASDKGKLYCLNHDMSVTSSIEQLSITNSLCWSPDSKTLYHCDTPSRKINRYDYDPESASIGTQRVFTQTDDDCYPDGSTVDSQGYLWNAQWGGSQVVRYAPDGSVDLTLDLPVSQPTCVAFGGKNLDLLFVTTAHQGFDAKQREKEPSAGNLFIFKTDFTGLAESPFISDPDKGMTATN